jgi:xanthine dehydrogenase iron-sulfur cluster and FAD-binding subunit A
MEKTITFHLNGKKITNVNPQKTLLEYIREEENLKGTKLGCNMGVCGSCTVLCSRYDHETKKIM